MATPLEELLELDELELDELLELEELEDEELDELDELELEDGSGVVLPPQPASNAPRSPIPTSCKRVEDPSLARIFMNESLRFIDVREKPNPPSLVGYALHYTGFTRARVGHHSQKIRVFYAMEAG